MARREGGGKSTTTVRSDRPIAISFPTTSRSVHGIHVCNLRHVLVHVSWGYFQGWCSEIPSVSPTPPHPIHQGPWGPSKDSAKRVRQGGERTASGTVLGIGGSKTDVATVPFRDEARFDARRT